MLDMVLWKHEWSRFQQEFGNLSMDVSGALIKYFRSIVAELWDSINIFVIVVEVLITRMAKLLVP